MRPPARRPEQPPPDMPAQSFREGNASRQGRSVLGKKTGFKTLAPFLVSRKASHIQVTVSSFRFFRSGNSEDTYNPELGREAYEIMRRIVMTYKYVDVINWLRGAKIDRWAEKEAVKPGE